MMMVTQAPTMDNVRQVCDGLVAYPIASTPAIISSAAIKVSWPIVIGRFSLWTPALASLHNARVLIDSALYVPWSETRSQDR